MSLTFRPSDTNASVYAKAARSCAISLWGPIQQQRVVIRGKAWGYITPGHGGFVAAVTPEEYAKLPKGLWLANAEVYAGAIRGARMIAFEEDINWSLAVRYLPGFAEGMAKQTASHDLPGLIQLAGEILARYADYFGLKPAYAER